MKGWSLKGGCCEGEGVSVKGGAMKEGSVKGDAVRGCCERTPQRSPSGRYSSYWDAFLLDKNFYRKLHA